jgi:GNAT superfamily N-acetyltransferase
MWNPQGRREPGGGGSRYDRLAERTGRSGGSMRKDTGSADNGIFSFGFEKSLRREFVEFPFHSYRRDPLWVPAQRSGVDFQISPRNPFFRYGISRNFLVRKAGRTVGRISAILNPGAVTEGNPVGYFAFFECLRDEEAAGRLVNAARDWLRAHGARAVRGPIQYSTYGGNRFVTRQGTEPPFFLEPYHPSWYPALFTNLGFQTVHRFLSHRADTLNPDEQLAPEAREQLSRQGYRVRPFQRKTAEQDLRTIYELSETCFATNFSFTSVPWEEFQALYGRIVSFVDPDFLLLLFSPEGHPAGYLFGCPDYAPALRAMKGRNGPAARIRFLLRRRHLDTVVLKTLAIHPDHQGNRLGSLLASVLHQTALRKGYTRMIYSTTQAEDSKTAAMAQRDSGVFREYALFEAGL